MTYTSKQSIEIEILKMEKRLAELDGTIREKLSGVIEGITELSPKALDKLIHAQETRNVAKCHFLFSHSVVAAFHNTPRRKWLFFKNPRYAAILLQTKSKVRMEILAGGLFFEEQVEANEVIRELEALKVQAEQMRQSELNSRSGLYTGDSSSGLSLKKKEQASPNARKAAPLFDTENPVNKPRQAKSYEHRQLDTSGRQTMRDDSLLDPLNPFNPLNPLSPLSPLSPFYAGHTRTEHDRIIPDPETAPDRECSAPYQDKQEMSTDADRCQTNDSYGSYS